MHRIYTLALIFFCVSLSSAQPVKKLLFLGIDGCRPDGIVAANTPALDTLMAHGTYCLEAQHIAPTISGPGWSSMLTGVWYTKHGVIDNTFTGSNYAQYPHFFVHLKQFDPTLFTASICQWAPVNTMIADSADLTINSTSTFAVADSAVVLLSTGDPDVLFLHFDDVDHAGHATGFGPQNPDYLAAITHVDSAIAKVIAAVEARPTYANEEWLIIVSTDHGGTGTSHGGNSTEERTIFQILSGGGMPVQQIVPATTSSISSTALSFNGTNQFASIPTVPAYNFGTATDFTIECRIITNGWTGDPSIISDKNWNSGLNKGFIIAGRTDGTTWKVNLGDGTNRIDINGGTINDGQMHHLTFSVQRTGLAKIYQDGVLVGSTSAAAIGDVFPNFPIGLAQDGTLAYPNFFNGIIDEVRIWNKAIDDTTVTDWACQNNISLHPDYANLIGYWKMNENIGTTIYDSSTTANNGMLINTPTWLTPFSGATCTDISNLPRMVDLAPTALKYFCVPIDTAWHLDGVSYSSFDCDTPLTVNNTINNTQSILIYPNPTNDQLTIETNSIIKEICITNTLGQVVIKQAAHNNKRTISTGHLLPGIYFITITDEANRKTTKKIIKE
jgi:hypothetical protein